MMIEFQYETISVWRDGKGDLLWVNLADGDGDMVPTKDGKSTVKVDDDGNILGFYIFNVSERATQKPFNFELVPEEEGALCESKRFSTHRLSSLSSPLQSDWY